MLFAKVPKQEADLAKSALIAAGVLDELVKVEKDTSHIYFPVRARAGEYEYVERDARPLPKPRELSEALADFLAPKERDELIGSYDIVGNIAIIDVPESLVVREQQIAQAVLDAHKHVTTVLKKEQKHGGEFRTQSLTFLAGEDTREAAVTESGCKMLVDVEQVYFSVRLSTERLRIARLVQPEESVLVMFSGAGPYVCILAKHSLASKIAGVEKNPVGHRYAEENLRLNKIKNVSVHEGDCVNLSFLEERFDRIVMPHPSAVLEFLPAALSVAKPFCKLHLYQFAREGEIPAIQGQITEICSQAGFDVQFYGAVKAGHHAPHVYRWCFDIAVYPRKDLPFAKHESESALSSYIRSS